MNFLCEGGRAVQDHLLGLFGNVLHNIVDTVVLLHKVVVIESCRLAWERLASAMVGREARMSGQKVP